MRRASSAAVLKSHENAVWREGQTFAKSAALARQQRQIEEAAWLTMRAQEEFAAARAIRYFRDDFATKSLSLTMRRNANSLRSRLSGFGTFIRSPGKGHQPPELKDLEPCYGSASVELSQLWCQTHIWLTALHASIRNASLAVAAFVLALAFLTISDASVRTRWPQVSWRFFIAGLVVQHDCLGLRPTLRRLCRMAMAVGWAGRYSGGLARAALCSGIRRRRDWVRPRRSRAAQFIPRRSHSSAGRYGHPRLAITSSTGSES